MCRELHSHSDGRIYRFCLVFGPKTGAKPAFSPSKVHVNWTPETVGSMAQLAPAALSCELDMPLLQRGGYEVRHQHCSSFYYSRHQF